MRTPLTRPTAALAAGLLVLGLAACGDDDDAADTGDDATQLADSGADGGAADEGATDDAALPGDGDAAGVTFVAEDNRFPTGTLTVAPGTEITFDNQGANPHTMTADDGAFDSGRVDGGSQGSVAAPGAPGTYAFHCDVHPAAMTGTLTVEG